MMIGGEFNTPADWLRAGDAVKMIDDFAAAHGGNAPVFVFVDPGGAFNNDTECVNGARGNSADHLTKDVVPYMESNYGVSKSAQRTGAWWAGRWAARARWTWPPCTRTCSAHSRTSPETSRPTPGTKAQTVDRLFGGNTAAYAAFDPTTVITRHGPYHGVDGWFDVNDGGSRTGQISGPERTGQGCGFAVCTGTRVRHRLRRGDPAGHSRLAVRLHGFRRGTAVAGGHDRHSRSAADQPARTAGVSPGGAGRCPLVRG